MKSFNRTTQTDQRLTGLCIICAYRDVAIDWEKVVNTFAIQNPRRMALINILDDDKEKNNWIINDWKLKKRDKGEKFL